MVLELMSIVASAYAYNFGDLRKVHVHTHTHLPQKEKQTNKQNVWQQVKNTWVEVKDIIMMEPVETDVFCYCLHKIYLSILELHMSLCKGKGLFMMASLTCLARRDFKFECWEGTPKV